MGDPCIEIGNPGGGESGSSDCGYILDMLNLGPLGYPGGKAE
jgi:hypothetical protein